MVAVPYAILQNFFCVDSKNRFLTAVVGSYLNTSSDVYRQTCRSIVASFTSLTLALLLQGATERGDGNHSSFFSHLVFHNTYGSVSYAQYTVQRAKRCRLAPS
jgi:hypothetical protein